MEDQVPSSNIPQEAGNYYQNPEGPRYQNPSDFAAAQQNQTTTTFEEMRERALAATRQLARRQLTWLRGWDGLERLPLGPDFALPSVSSLAKAFPCP